MENRLSITCRQLARMLLGNDATGLQNDGKCTHFDGMCGRFTQNFRDHPANGAGRAIPQTLASRLTLATPSLRKKGIDIQRGKSNGERWILISQS
jgi:hypothetical protein